MIYFKTLLLTKTNIHYYINIFNKKNKAIKTYSSFYNLLNNKTHLSTINNRLEIVTSIQKFNLRIVENHRINLHFHHHHNH